MAGACGCERYRGKACGKVWRVSLRAGKRQVWTLLKTKNRWLGCVAARVAVERLAGGFEGGQTAGVNACKIKRTDKHRSQLLPRMGTKGCRGDGEGIKDKGGGETVVCDKVVLMYVCVCVRMYVRTYVWMFVCMSATKCRGVSRD